MGEKTLMATNNFKPFAVGSSANVTTQTDYESLPALQSGFQSGKASSAQINKALRQSSFISSALAQVVSNILSSDVLDDGNQGKFVNQLISAMTRNALSVNRQLRLTTSGSFTVPDGVTTLYVSGCGGGGGGGGSQTSINATVAGSGGGSGGGFIEKFAMNVTPGQVINAIVGAGGSGGAAGGGTGFAGGTSSFGVVSLQGGYPGQVGSSSQTSASGGAPGLGGSAGSGGGHGSWGGDSQAGEGGGAYGGSGGHSPFGAAGGQVRGNINPIAGLSAAGYGAGGGGAGGANVNGAHTGAKGGDGAPGLLIIEW
jgi:hypothetical protein